VITLLIGLALGLLHQRRITQINQALDKIADGDFSVKIKPPILRDDLDIVSAKIDATSDRIEVLLQQMKNLSVNIAHDLKTPLARIRVRLESALVEKDNQLKNEALENVLMQTDQMINTFDAILRIAHIDSGERKAHFKMLPLKNIVQEIADIYAAVIEDSGRQFTIEIDSDVMVLGDRELLIQLVANLLENAIRHTPANQQITLAVKGRCIVVSDHGPGIPPSQRDRVLEPMYRLDKSRHTKGNGLGLALVKAIAELHDAQLVLAYVFNGQDEAQSYGLKVSLCLPAIS
jgi:signal transduction histidine kinase